MDDHVNVKNGLKKFGFNDFNIHSYQNADQATVTSAMRGCQRMLETNDERGVKTVLVVYYAGHGCMRDNTTQLLLNDDAKTYYKMENRVRALS